MLLWQNTIWHINLAYLHKLTNVHFSVMHYFFCKKHPLHITILFTVPLALSLSLTHIYTNFLSLNPSSIQKCLPMGIERVYFCKSYPASACLPIFFASEIIPIFYVTLISIFVLHHFRPLCFSFRIFYYAF